MASDARRKAAHELQLLLQCFLSDQQCPAHRPPLDIANVLQTVRTRLKREACWSNPRPSFVDPSGKPSQRPDPGGQCLNLLCELACIAALKDLANTHPDPAPPSLLPSTLLEQIFNLQVAMSESVSDDPSCTILQWLVAPSGQSAAVEAYWPGKNMNERNQGRGHFVLPPDFVQSFIPATFRLCAHCPIRLPGEQTIAWASYATTDAL